MQSGPSRVASFLVLLLAININRLIPRCSSLLTSQLSKSPRRSTAPPVPPSPTKVTGTTTTTNNNIDVPVREEDSPESSNPEQDTEAAKTLADLMTRDGSEWSPHPGARPIEGTPNSRPNSVNRTLSGDLMKDGVNKFLVDDEMRVDER